MSRPDSYRQQSRNCHDCDHSRFIGGWHEPELFCEFDEKIGDLSDEQEVADMETCNHLESDGDVVLYEKTVTSRHYEARGRCRCDRYATCDEWAKRA